MRTDKKLFIRARAKRVELLTSAPAVSEWPGPILDDLPEPDRERFLNSRRAVQMWVNGANEKSIKRDTFLNVDAARRLTMQCVRVNPRTRSIFGFWACLPGFRVGGQLRQRFRGFKPGLVGAGKGMTGALWDVFSRHAGIEEKLREFVTKRTESGAAPVSVLTIANIYERFIALCKDHGLRERNEWPFTVKRGGYEALRRWYKKFRHEQPARSIRNELGDDAANLDKIDRQVSHSPKPREAHLAYERTELDEHKEDGLWSILTPLGNDQYAYAASTRLYALVMRDAGSAAALASGISYKRRYAKADILRLAYAALVPPARKTLIITNRHFQYDPQACYPGELNEFTKLMWQGLALDADRAHFSEHVLAALEYEIGCHVYGERIGNATARYGIEDFFKLLARMCENLPSATGNRPGSPARRDPESAAKRWNIVAPLAEHMLDVKCRNYNVTPSAACEGLSPIQRLHEMLAKGQIYRSPLGELRKANLYRFLPQYPAKLTRKRGSKSLSPFGVNLFGGRYVGPELAKDAELSYCGDTDVTVYVQEDATHAFIVPRAFPDRCYPVALTGAYSDMPHTIEWRRVTAAYRKNMHIKGKINTASLMTGVLRGLGDAAKTDNAAASLLSGVTAFMDRHGRGDTTYIDLGPDKRERLSAFAQQVAEADEAEGLEDDDVLVLSDLPLYTPPINNLAPAKPAISTVPESKGRASDPFGLL